MCKFSNFPIEEKLVLSVLNPMTYEEKYQRRSNDKENHDGNRWSQSVLHLGLDQWLRIELQKSTVHKA